MSSFLAVGSGLVGATALTAVHETVRRQREDAPRMDILGERAITKSLLHLGQPIPSPARLHRWAMLGDLVSNSLFYSLVACGKPEKAPRRGAMLGLAAGLGALALPRPMGLDQGPSNRTRPTQIMTVAWYLLGGVAAGATYWLLSRKG